LRRFQQKTLQKRSVKNLAIPADDAEQTHGLRDLKEAKALLEELA